MLEEQLSDTNLAVKSCMRCSDPTIVLYSYLYILNFIILLTATPNHSHQRNCGALRKCSFHNRLGDKRKVHKGDYQSGT